MPNEPMDIPSYTLPESKKLDENEKNINNDNDDDIKPYKKLSPDHYPITFLTGSGIPIIIFIPNDTTEETLRTLLHDELQDSLYKIKARQSFFIYSEDNSEKLIPLKESSIILKDIQEIKNYQNHKKFPILSIGNSSIINNESINNDISLKNNNNDKVISPNLSPRLLTPTSSPPPEEINNNNITKKEKKLQPQQLSLSSIDTIIDNDKISSNRRLNRVASVAFNNLEYTKPLNISSERREAIPVNFCFGEKNLLLNLPRKADIETIKRLALQRLGIEDHSTANSVRYTLKVTGTSYFIVEGECLLEDLPIVKFCQKKGLTTMLSLVTKEKSKEDKLISKKIGLILSDSHGRAILNWHMKDTDATDFRIKMSRIVGDRPYKYNPGVFIKQSGPIDSELPSIFKVCVHLGEEGGTGLQDCATVLQMNGSSKAKEIIEKACKKFRFAANFILIPDDYILKICGFEVYIKSSYTLDSINYVRECLRKKKQISFALIPIARVPYLERLDIKPGDSLLKNTPFDTTNVDSYGDKETVSILELKSKFEFKVRAIDYLSSIGKKDGEIFYLTSGIYHGGELIGNIMISPTSSIVEGVLRWKNWMRSSIRICEIPEDSRICITLYNKKDSTTSIPIANVNASLFDFKDHFLTGNISLQMWLDGEANPIGTCMENLRANRGTVPVIHLSFHSFPMNVAFPHLKPLCEYGDKPNPPSIEEQNILKKIINSDPLHRLKLSEKELLWNNREWIRSNCIPKSLIKILLCVKWQCINQVREIYRLLLCWKEIHPDDALQLLDAQFANRKVREYAVHCLDQLSDEELKDYLLQLVQTLKYEPNHFSPLAVWLLNRALQNQIEIGHYFFWMLKSELHVPEIAERYALLLEMYLRGCGKQREDLLKQVQVVNKLNEVAEAIKNVPSSRRKADLQKRLKEIQFPDEFQLPLDPLRKANGLIIEKCKSMDSAKAPLWLVFKNADPLGDSIWLIFKSGDDLRQDSLTLQMLEIMDKIWLSDGLELCLTPYKCIATGDEMGMIETVLDSDTTANIQKAAGGVTGALKQTPLANWLKNHNPDGYDQAVINFTRSCAGYCVATYVLGIGDRHNDNIMVNKHGFLFRKYIIIIINNL